MKNKNLFNHRFVFKEGGPDKNDTVKPRPDSVAKQSTQDEEARVQTVKKTNEMELLFLKPELERLKAIKEHINALVPWLLTSKIEDRINEAREDINKMHGHFNTSTDYDHVYKDIQNCKGRLKKIEIAILKMATDGEVVKANDSITKMARRKLEEVKSDVSNEEVLTLAILICKINRIRVPDWNLKEGDKSDKKLKKGNIIYIPRSTTTELTPEQKKEKREKQKAEQKLDLIFPKKPT